jgi:hypothetical protein
LVIWVIGVVREIAWMACRGGQVAGSIRLQHFVPESAVGAEEARLVKALTVGGYEAGGLDLVPVARAAVVRDLIAKVRQAGAHVVTAPWIQRSSGGAEIEFELVGEGDLAVAMMALAE